MTGTSRVVAVLLASAALAWTVVSTLRSEDRLAALTLATATERRLVRPEPVATDARPWPPVFGVAVPAAVPVDPISPPDRPDYVLKGVAVLGPTRRAILSVDGTERLIREGETLGDGWRIARIGTAGVDVRLNDETVTLAFRPTGQGPAPRPEAASADVSSLAVVSGVSQGAGFRGITDEEIGEILAAAAARRAMR